MKKKFFSYLVVHDFTASAMCPLWNNCDKQESETIKLELKVGLGVSLHPWMDNCLLTVCLLNLKGDVHANAMFAAC